MLRFERRLSLWRSGRAPGGGGLLLLQALQRRRG